MAETVQMLTASGMKDYLGAGPVRISHALLDKFEVVGHETIRANFRRIDVP